jgi:hypothetical protein
MLTKWDGEQAIILIQTMEINKVLENKTQDAQAERAQFNFYENSFKYREY